MSGGRLSPGIYERIVTELLRQDLDALPRGAEQSESLTSAELPDRLSRLLADLVKRALSALDDDERIH